MEGKGAYIPGTADDDDDEEDENSHSPFPHEALTGELYTRITKPNPLNSAS